MEKILIIIFNKYKNIVTEYSEEEKSKNSTYGQLCIEIIEKPLIDENEILEKYKKINIKKKLIPSSIRNLASGKEKILIESLELLNKIEKIEAIEITEKKYFPEEAILLKNVIEKLRASSERMTIFHLMKKYNLDKYEETFKLLRNDQSKYFLIDLIDMIEEFKMQFTSEEKIKKLENEIFELRNSLSLLSIENENLAQELEELKENSEINAKLEIFEEMNSSSNDSLLDNFFNNDNQLNSLRKLGYEIPKELESISITTRSFMKILKKLEVKQIQKIGRIINLTLEDSIDYQYFGSEFENSEEIKEVKIESPGWKYKNKIISKPIVKEVVKNDE